MMPSTRRAESRPATPKRPAAREKRAAGETRRDERRAARNALLCFRSLSCGDSSISQRAESLAESLPCSSSIHWCC